jgi:hypothetical protein
MTGNEEYHVGKNRLSTALGRWMGIGPYFAMFPISFAYDVVQRYCPPGGSVLDPFAGRASSIYAASTTGRLGVGIEINKVGWLYGRVKLDPAPLDNVLRRNRQIGESSAHVLRSRIEDLPEFYRLCYTDRVLKYLLTARDQLDWLENQVDATLMAIILVYLHGAREKALSNQMRQSKAMAPAYSVLWWRTHQLCAPDVVPDDFLEQRIRWRYAYGTPRLSPRSKVLLGDSSSRLGEVRRSVESGDLPRFDLLFTSPPYYNVTSYHYDQWLRLWMLGADELPSKTGGDWQNGFWSRARYETLLEQVFEQCASVMATDARVYVRTDAREYTRETTIAVLRSVFPDKSLRCVPMPMTKRAQTALFGDRSSKPGEFDIVMMSQ